MSQKRWRSDKDPIGDEKYEYNTVPEQRSLTHQETAECPFQMYYLMDSPWQKIMKNKKRPLTKIFRLKKIYSGV